MRGGPFSLPLTIGKVKTGDSASRSRSGSGSSLCRALEARVEGRFGAGTTESFTIGAPDGPAVADESDGVSAIVVAGE